MSASSAGTDLDDDDDEGEGRVLLGDTGEQQKSSFTEKVREFYGQIGEVVTESCGIM